MSILKMQAFYSSETLVTIYQTAIKVKFSLQRAMKA
jgi:hypothetical protein